MRVESLQLIEPKSCNRVKAVAHPQHVGILAQPKKSQKERYYFD